MPFLAVSALSTTKPVIVYEGSRNHSQRIGSGEFGSLNTHSNQLIREYATALATNPANLTTYFQCEISREVTIGTNGEASVWFRVISGSVKGDSYLKGFNISDVLMPSLFNASLILKGSDGDTLLVEKKKSVRITNGNSIQIRFRVELPPQTDTLRFEIENLFFFYDDRDVQKLITRIQKIADYYAADYLLDNVKLKLASVNCRQFDFLPQCFLTLIEVDRILQHIGKANFQEHLFLGISDPEGLQRRFEIASNTYTFLLREFTNTLHQTNRIYLTQTEEALVLQYIDGITSFIDDNPKPGFAAAPFINAISAISYSGKDFVQKANYFRQIVAKINPGLTSAQASTELLSLVYDAMVSKAKDYVEAVEFNKAVVLLENAGRFCEAFHELECSDDAYFELSKAKHGLFGFYLKVADRAIEMQRPDIAASYVFLARDYQRNNSRLIIYDGEVTIMLVKLFDAYVLKAAQYNKAEYFDSAMIVLNRTVESDIGITPSFAWHSQHAVALNGLLKEKLHSFWQTLSSQPLTVTESQYHNLAQFVSQKMSGVELASENKFEFRNLQQQFAAQLVSAAREDIGRLHFEESMRKLLLVKGILGNRLLETNIAADSLSLIAGREVINRMLRETVSLINQGKTDEGFELFSQAVLRSEAYGLHDDEITKSSLDEIYVAYIAIRCMQLQTRLDIVLQQAERFASSRMYVNAIDTLKRAIRQLNDYQACTFSLDFAHNFINKYNFAAEFQNAIQVADRALLQNDYIACLRNIENAETLFNEHNLRQFGMRPFSMYDYAVEKGNTALDWYIAGRYVQMQDFNRAIAILELMRKAGVSSSETIGIQKDLGAFMGEKDRNEVNFFQSFSRPKEYTGGNSYYKAFYRAYRHSLGYRFPWFF